MKIDLVHSKKDLQVVHGLQKEVYKFDSSEQMPLHTLISIMLTGGYVLKLTVDKKIVGYSVLMSANNNHGNYLYLYMIGILDKHQNKGYALSLMNKHIEIAKGAKINILKWSFNPFSAQLTNFYLNKFGAEIEQEYIKNMYSEDHITSVDSDRVIAKVDVNKTQNVTKDNYYSNLKMNELVEVDVTQTVSLNIFKSKNIKVILLTESAIIQNQAYLNAYRSLFTRLMINYSIKAFEYNPQTKKGCYYFQK